MIIVTGAAGFIGSCLATELYRLGYKDLVLVDEFSRADKLANLDAIPQPLLVPVQQSALLPQWPGASPARPALRAA